MTLSSEEPPMDVAEPDALVREVGVRELHDQLSQYVRHVESGGEVVVTMRGRRIARLTGVSEARDPLEGLRARGLVRDPEYPRHREAGRARITAAGSVSDLVREQRR